MISRQGEKYHRAIPGLLMRQLPGNLGVAMLKNAEKSTGFGAQGRR
jgi:hypothetical protein